MKSFYDILGVSAEAEDVVIDAAYRAMMKRHHPDISGADAQHAQDINEAYSILRDPEARARYDRDQNYRGFSEDAVPARPVAPGPAARRSDGFGVSLFFGGLAGLVLLGAVGSLAHGGSSAPVASTPMASPPVAAATETFPGPEAAETPSIAAALPTASQTGVVALQAEPSFDCRQANSDVLRLICREPDLAAADAKLATRYREAVRDSQEPEALRRAQRAWLVVRNETPPEPGALLALYNRRLSQLEQPIAAEEPPF